MEHDDRVVGVCSRRSAAGRADAGRIRRGVNGPLKTSRSRWTVDDRPDREGARNAAGPGAADFVADVSAGRLGRHRRGGFLYEAGLDLARAGDVLHAVVIDFVSRPVQTGSTPYPNDLFMRQVRHSLAARTASWLATAYSFVTATASGVGPWHGFWTMQGFAWCSGRF
jgi:hypothetical protein